MLRYCSIHPRIQHSITLIMGPILGHYTTYISRQPKVVRIIQAYHDNIDILEIVMVCLLFPYYFWLSRYKCPKIGIRAAYVLFQVEGRLQ